MTRARFHDLAGRSAYQVLGVTEAAGADEINRGYRRRMRELHPDSPGGVDRGEEAQRVTTAHRWLMRHRDDYDLFVSDRRRADPLWGRVPAVPAPSVEEPRPLEEPRRRAAPGTGALRTPGAPVTGSFRTAGQERLAERAAEWAERQRRERWKSEEAAEPRREWRRDPGPETAAVKTSGRARSAWVSEPSPERQMWDASREEVSRRREERRRADEERRAADFRDTAERVVGAFDREAESGKSPESEPRPASVPFVSPVASAKPRQKVKRRRKIRWPRLGLPKAPPLGLPQAPRVGLPAVPRVGLPRIGVRVLPRRRARAGVRLESVVLAVLIIVLGFMVAARLPL